MNQSLDLIDELIASFPGGQSDSLNKIRMKIRNLVPGAEESVFYQMPSFSIAGINLISYQGFKNHNSLFPGPEVITALSEELVKYKTSKGAIQFGIEDNLNLGLLKKILRTRIEVVNSTFPKRSGEFLEFYDNGFLKAKGKYKNDLMSGHWDFYRRDGSLMRSGQLKNGEPIGEWTTHLRT